MQVTDKKREPEQIGITMISQIIGPKPRVPQTYNMRKVRGTESDIEFCDRIDKRVADWNEKADVIRAKQMEDRSEEKELCDAFVIKEVPAINFTELQLYADFKSVYKIQNKTSFNQKNPFSGTNEPHQYIFTLMFYFMKDERFFKSPLLRKDLSEPSFDKGTLSIGGYGCGKTSTWNALLTCFSNHLKFVEEIKPCNQDELISKYKLNKCISSEIVNSYNTTKDKATINEILLPLLSNRQLYIDDILREEKAFNFSPKNIFKDVLTHRADRKYKTHLSMNFMEMNVDGNIKFKNTVDSLLEFRNRYDGRIHDRLFGEYNIIELSGKSFRR